MQEESTIFVPIACDLHYDDGDENYFEIPRVDVSAHLLRAFPDEASLVSALADGALAFDDILSEQFLGDPELEDEHGRRHAWTAQLHLPQALAAATGLDPSLPVQHLWRTWSASALAAGILGAKDGTDLSLALDELDRTIDSNPSLQTPDGLAAAFASLLRRPHGIEAARSAASSYDGGDAVGAMRLAAALSE